MDQARTSPRNMIIAFAAAAALAVGGWLAVSSSAVSSDYAGKGDKPVVGWR